ncbi:MAG: hypothetical protein PVF74_09000, partial [Anaerolineales bacterium]
LDLTLTHYPNSDPTQVVTHTLTGKANPYGYFSSDDPPITFTQPGEYRVDLTAVYTDTSGTLYMGALTWGGIVMTPSGQADLIAHGRRGVDSLSSIPNHWFVSCRDLPIQPGVVTHTLNPYFNGDMIWSRMVDAAGECPTGITSGGDALILGSSVQDTVGVIEAAIQGRVDRRPPPTSPPGDINERFSKGELPLFSSTRSGQPVHFVLGEIGAAIPEDVDQIAYSYRTSQRPGVRVREIVAEDDQSGGYWRLDTLYDDQLGVGIQGDQPNDFKFQYVGAVFRDLDSGHNEYVGQGSGWVFIPDSDTTGTRVMPPFSGPGNGGWTTEGGPILTLKGEEVHIFMLPTGVRPGGVLQVGDTFHFAGHIMPTLDSQVTYTVTTPSSIQYIGGGQANSVGYFYEPQDDFLVNEAGLWSVDVHIWQDGQCSGGSTIPPYHSGDVLGSENARYWFYVVPEGAPRLQVSSPTSGFLSFENEVTPVQITGAVPEGLSNVRVDYTISMPGTILKHGTLIPTSSTFTITFDPVVLHNDFPNLDLIGRDGWDKPGLADTISIALLLEGQADSEKISLANTITLQGDQVFVKNRTYVFENMLFIPLVSRP